jgi:hypothetical protein
MNQIAVNEVWEALEVFAGSQNLIQFKVEISDPYHAKSRWFQQDDSARIPFATENGVYIYSAVGGEILYIGKGEREGKGGIGYRSCAHLGPAQRDHELMFPFHQWAPAFYNVPEEKKNLIATGNFEITAIKVVPDFCTSLVEVFLQTYTQDKYGALPALNMRIG